MATCSAGDLVHLWSTPLSGSSSNAMDTSSAAAAAATAGVADKKPGEVPTVRPLVTLRGHADRCCRVAFHPSGRFLGSTSFDTTWRLWDIETSKELLTQGYVQMRYYAILTDGAVCCVLCAVFV